MLTTLTRRSFTAGFSTLALAFGKVAAAQGALLIAIPPGNAGNALIEWNEQTGIEVLYDYEVVNPWRTRGAVGTLTPLDALGLMLRDTPLAYEVISPRVVAVKPGTRYCEPWLSPQIAPLPPCVQLPKALQGGRV